MSLVRGEWWIDDDGQETFADGDIGDVTHEMVAFGRAANLDEEEMEAHGINPADGFDLTALGEAYLHDDLMVREDIVDVAKWPEKKWLELIEENDLNPFDKNEGGYSWEREEVLGLNKLDDMGANLHFVFFYIGQGGV